MKKYYVYRKLVVGDSCVVEANTKKEAIEKAKKDQFYENETYEDFGWQMGGAERTLKKYEAEEQ